MELAQRFNVKLGVPSVVRLAVLFVTRITPSWAHGVWPNDFRANNFRNIC